MRTLLRPALVALLVLSLITGVVYPAAITGVSAVLFPRQAGGSRLLAGDTLLGSALIGQGFTEPGYFWSRPSATGPVAYNGAVSGGSNLGPSHPVLHEAIAARVAALRAADPGRTDPVPVDLVTASGSGLDPHITPAAAAYQVPRVSRVRGVPEDSVRALVARSIEGRQFGVLGEPRVNVLRLNLALDSLPAAP